MQCTAESTKLIDSIRVVGTAAAATDDDGDDNDGAVAAKWISF